MPVVFGKWVSSYFDHPNVDSRELAGLEQHMPTASHRPSTTETLVPHELFSVIDPYAASRCEPQFNDVIDPNTMRVQTYRSLFDTELAKRFLPKLEIKFVYCRETLWSVYWAAWELENDIKQKRLFNVNGRDVSIICRNCRLAATDGTTRALTHSVGPAWIALKPSPTDANCGKSAATSARR